MIAAYLFPYVRAWGDGSDAGDAFDDCEGAFGVALVLRGIAHVELGKGAVEVASAPVVVSVDHAKFQNGEEILRRVRMVIVATAELAGCMRPSSIGD